MTHLKIMDDLNGWYVLISGTLPSRGFLHFTRLHLPFWDPTYMHVACYCFSTPLSSSEISTECLFDTGMIVNIPYSCSASVYYWKFQPIITSSNNPLFLLDGCGMYLGYCLITRDRLNIFSNWTTEKRVKAIATATNIFSFAESSMFRIKTAVRLNESWRGFVFIAEPTATRNLYRTCAMLWDLSCVSLNSQRGYSCPRALRLNIYSTGG